MHVKKMWNQTEWNNHVRRNPSTPDLIFEINECGDIPLECGGCKKKVHDVETKRKKVGKFIEIQVMCSSCDWEGFRFLGER